MSDDHRPSQPSSRRRRRAAWIAAVASVLVIVACGAALAWTVGTTNPDNALTAATLGTPGTPSLSRTPTTGASCTSVALTWTGAAGADRYLVEKNLTGAWTTLAASHTTTSITDTPTTAYTNLTVEYRITPRLASSTDWSGTPRMAEVTCGVGDVDDLVLTSTCSSNVLTWGAQPGATRYDVYRSIGTGAFSLVGSNVTGTTWTDTTAHPVGSKLSYYVRGDATGGTAPASNTVVNDAFDPFRVTDVTFTNTGAANSLNAGDRVAITFSQPSNGTTPSGTNSTSLYVRVSGGTRGVYFASNAASAASSGIGVGVFSANISGTNAAHAGTASWNAAKTTWTWTRGAGTAAPYSQPAWSSFTIGTRAANPARVKCSDGSVMSAASTPTANGWF